MEWFTAVKKFFAMAGSFVVHLAHRYRRDGCNESAAALTYMSLFAVVPLMTVTYAMFSLIPAFQGLGDQVQGLIFENLLPQSGSEVQRHLSQFSTQARKLSAFGGFILIVTSYLMLTNIEKTFNHIWGTAGGRKGLSSFLLYWGILSFGPLLLGIGLMMHTYLLSFKLVTNEVEIAGVSHQILEYLPWLMTWIAFTLLFIAVPNCKVSVRYALTGGLVSMLLFQSAKAAFGALVVDSSYHTVYGAFTIVPVFLLWTYLCWMIILGGAELVRSLETFKAVYKGYNFPNLVAAVLVCWACWRGQQNGHSLSDKDVLRCGVDEQHWLKLRTILLTGNVLVTTASGGYVLARDPAQLTLWELVNLFGDNFVTEPSASAKNVLAAYPWSAPLAEVIGAGNRETQQLYDRSLADLFTTREDGDGTSATG